MTAWGREKKGQEKKEKESDVRKEQERKGKEINITKKDRQGGRRILEPEKVGERSQGTGKSFFLSNAL